MLDLLMKHCVSCLVYYVRLKLIRNETHCIHNWPVTREIKTPLNSAVLGLLAIGMMHFGPRLELLGFCPPLGQFNGVQWW